MPNDPTQTVEKAIAGTDAINDAAGPLLREHAAVLAGKVVIDATNPLKPDLTGLPPTGDGIGRRVTAMGGPIGAAVQGLQHQGVRQYAEPRLPTRKGRHVRGRPKRQGQANRYAARDGCGVRRGRCQRLDLSPAARAACHALDQARLCPRARRRLRLCACAAQ